MANTDFDPDAYLRSAPQQAPAAEPAFDPDKYLATSDEKKPGILEATLQGIQSGTHQLQQSAEAIRGGRPKVEAESSPAAAPFEWGDVTSPFSSGAPKVAYRLAEGYPGLAGGIAGGILGGAAGTAAAGPVGGTVGGIAGGVAGTAAASAVQTLGPSFAQELSKTPDDPDGAFDRAMRTAEISGAFSGAGWALFPVRFFQGPVKQLLFQAFVAQPGVSVAHRATENVRQGQPVTEGLGEAYTEGAVGTAVPMIGHKVISTVGNAMRPATLDPHQQLLSVMDRIDRGETVPPAEDTIDYQGMDAAARSLARSDVQRLVAANGKPQDDQANELRGILGEPPVERASEPAPAVPEDQRSILGEEREEEARPDSEYYVNEAMRNLRATSRTANGVLDTSSTPGKEDQMTGVSATHAATLAKENFESVIRGLHDRLDELPQDGPTMAGLIDGTAESVNEGIVKPGEIMRTNNTKIPAQTAAMDLPAAHEQFSEEMAQRLADPNADPVETAAWIEWRANVIDHFWTDGVGKTSKALAAIPLMRAGLPLPNYPSNREFYSYSPKERVIANRAPDAPIDGQAYLGPAWERFNAFYHTMVGKPEPQQRAELKTMLENPQTPLRDLTNYPLVQRALEDNRNALATGRQEDFADPEWRAQRQYQFGEERVRGLDNAMPRFIDQARAFSTAGPVRNERHAVVVLGPPASGKSTVSEPVARSLHGALVDPDEVKKAIIEYRNGLGTQAVHEESSAIARKVFGSLVREGANIVLPKVGASYDSIKGVVDLLKKAGYTVDIAHVAADHDTSQRRNITRFLESGRLVDPEYITEVGDKPRDTAYMLKGEANDFIDASTLHGFEIIEGSGPLAEVLRVRRNLGWRPDQGTGRDNQGTGSSPELVGEPVLGFQAHRVTDAAGRIVEVAPIVVEASSLRTSRDYGYDPELQPRDRDRAASERQIRKIVNELDPERLGYSSEADRGAPIIGADGMVESGNGRILALREVFEKHPEQAQRYRDWLAKQGVNVDAYQNPIIVRQRLTPLTPKERRDFTHNANLPATLAMSAPERAASDARNIDARMLGLIKNPEDLGAIANRAFVRRFVSFLPQTEQGSFADDKGHLSAEGLTRVRNAIMAKAYGDSAVLARVAESTNDEVKSISNALMAAAPEWARLRADVEAGHVRPDMDATRFLVEAVERTAEIRSRGEKLDTFLDQHDAFNPLPRAVQDFMKAFYDTKGRKVASAQKITDSLRFYAQEAAKVTAEKGLGLDLVPVEPHDILRLAQEKRERQNAGVPESGHGIGDGANDAARGREARGSWLGEGREVAAQRRDASDPVEEAIRAQQPTLDELRARDRIEPKPSIADQRRLDALDKQIKDLRRGSDFAYDLAVNDKGAAIKRLDDQINKLYREQETIRNKYRPATEKTKAGDQFVFPGGERISSAELLRRRSAEPLRPRLEQRPADFGLFGDTAQQTDLLNTARGRPAVLYHQSPSENRESIQRSGLLQSESHAAQVAKEMGDTGGAGIFFSEKRTSEPNIDTWKVDARGLSVDPDDTTVPSDKADKWWVHHDADIPPNRLTLMSDALPNREQTPTIEGTTETGDGSQSPGIQPAAPAVPGRTQARRLAKTPVKRPPELPLFGWGASERPVRHADETVRTEPGSEGPAVHAEGPSVTKPPTRSGRNRPGRDNLPAVKGRVEAEQKIAERSRSNYRITPEDQIGVGNARQKINGNIEAIRTLKAIQDENRFATPAEKAILVKYTGWGAFAQDMFATHKPEWKNERDAFRALVSDEEYNAAKASTLNAHFTSPDVIRGIWDAMEHLGFKGGQAIEPAAGVGHFIGLIPDKFAPKTAWTAVELDPLTGGIAKSLYGGSDVAIHGFEELKRPSNYYDLAVSNVPFGDYHISEKPYGSFPIHDFFFVKSLDKVRPGGVVSFITSRYTMDRVDPETRRLLGQTADLVGAIRLPGGRKGAFAGNAGTEVTTDIIFLRKKVPGEPAFPGAKWDDLKEIKTKDGPVEINEYFAEHPEMMLGEMRLQGSMYRANEPVLVGDPEGIQERIAEAARKMPEGAMLPMENPPPPPISGDEIGAGIKDGSFFVQNGKLYQRRQGQGFEHKLSPEETDRVTRLVDMRGIYNDLLDTQLNAGENAKEQAEHLRGKLRAAYDAFVAKHGPINKEVRTVTNRLNKDGEPIVTVRRPNLDEFRADPDYTKVAAIENYDSETGKTKRAAIQTKDVINAPRERQINGPSDALSASLNDTAGVDLDHIAQSLNLDSHDAVVHALGDQIYQNPDGRKWETADQYLSGDVVKKLEDARALSQQDPSYLRNVSALEKVQPEPLTGSDITAQFGAPWIPTEVYQDFLSELGIRNPKVARVPITGEWKFDYGSATRDAQTKFGTDRVEVGKIINAALNNKQVTVYDRGKDKDVVNDKATQEARVKTELLKEAFTGDADHGLDGWVFADPDRAQLLEGIYNRTYNNLAQRKFDGSHLTLPGLNSDFSERKHRRDAIWRIIQSGNTLLAHVVGSGKTVTGIAGMMEQKRLGLINKPAAIIPNHMLEQFSREWLEAYPNAKILVAQKDEMTREHRKEFLAKVSANDWDGIIMTHSAFGRINMGQEFRRKFIQDQLDELERVMRSEAASGDKKSQTVKNLEKAKKKLQERLHNLMNEERKDDGTSFEESGIDHLFVDEAHCFPHDTLIATDRGLLKIGDIVENKLPVLVASFDHKTCSIVWRRVHNHWKYRRGAVAFVIVRTTESDVCCTVNHQVFVDGRGYVRADEIKPGEALRVIGEKGLRALRSTVSIPQFRQEEQRQATILREPMRFGVANGATWANGQVDGQNARRHKRDVAHGFGLSGSHERDIFGADEGAQSNAVLGRTKENASFTIWPDLSGAWRQWPADEAATSSAFSDRLADGVCDRDVDGEGAVSESAKLLQGRSGGCRAQTCNRGGRQQPPHAQMAVSGSPQNGSVGLARVVSVEIIEQGSDQEPRSGDRTDSYVYDLGIEGEHNYFANGILVHNSFKNLQFITRLSNISGLAQGNSQRAEDLFLKIRYLEQKRPGRSAVFATGTPVSNTMAELWTMMRYLELDKLRERGLDTFDSWASTFGRVVNNMELSPDGRTFKEKSSFSKFVNIPELVALYSEIADTKTADMLNLPRPEVKTRSGAPGIEIVEATPSSQEEAHIESLVKLAESLKGKRPEKGQPNMLSVVTAGRKVATDGRLIGSDFDFNPEGKIAKAVDNISRIYQDGNTDKAAPNKVQMVFLDMGVPQSRSAKKRKPVEVDGEISVGPTEQDRIDLYADLKQRLVDKGIPAREIAAIHDAADDDKKAKLFSRVRSGDIRVILGSSEKMGVGTNVQDRLIAMHHLDAPWKPAEVEQRDGRIVRQGNQNKEVQIYRYVTKKSFDAFMWQKLDTKSKFIGQVLSGAKGSRHAEDIDNPLPEAAEMKAAASGDPRIMEHAELDRVVRSLSAQRRAYESTKSRASSEIGQAKSRIGMYEEALPNAKEDARAVQDIAGDKFVAELGDVGAVTNRADAGKAILGRLAGLDPRTFYTPKVFNIGRLSGFTMNMEVRGLWDGSQPILRATPSLKGKSGYSASNDTVINEHTDPAGLIRRYENILANIRTNPERLERELANEKESLGKLQRTQAGVWPKEAEYREALKKLDDLSKAMKAPEHPDVKEAQEAEVKAQRPAISEEKEFLTVDGKPAWAVVVDPVDNAILHSVRYAHAADNDFHHNYYLPERFARMVSDGDAVLAWGDAQGVHAMEDLQPQMRAAIMRNYEGPAKAAAPFYSTVVRTIENAKQEKASPEQWLGTLRNAAGVKPEELQWLGLDDWLKEQKGSVTKQAIMDYVRANQIEVKDVKKGVNVPPRSVDAISEWLRKEYGEADREAEITPADMMKLRQGDAEVLGRLEGIGVPDKLLAPIYAALDGVNPGESASASTKFGQWQLPGGENYRELLLTLPPPDWHYPGRKDAPSAAAEAKVFRGSHWDEPNVLAHIRFNDRTIDGKRTLFLEEVQSDWHQKGRKQGYAKPISKELAELRELDKIPGRQLTDAQRKRASELMDIVRDEEKGAIRAVPDAPFKTTWPELAMKRMIRYAAENGYDQIAWTPGEVQNDRYSLAKHIDKLKVVEINPDQFHVEGFKKNEKVIDDHVTKDGLAGAIGKDRAAKALEEIEKNKNPSDRNKVPTYAHTFTGENIDIGGAGMRSFYDRELPNTVNKLVKKFGTKVAEGKLPERGSWEVYEREGGPFLGNARTFGEMRDARAAGKFIKENPDAEGRKVHTVPITPELRDAAVGQGFPMFRKGWESAEGRDLGPKEGERAVQIGRSAYAHVSDKYSAAEQKIADAVKAVGDRMAPQADVVGAKALRMNGQQIWGAFVNSETFPHLIAWSLERSNDPRAIAGTVRHEIIHHLRESGLIQPKEWAALRDAAVKDDWLGKHEIHDRYPGLSLDHKIEEAVAEQFSRWRKERSIEKPGLIRDAFHRMDLMLRRVAAAARQFLGRDATANDVFTRIETGEVGRREMPGREAERMAAQAEKVTHVPISKLQHEVYDDHPSRLVGLKKSIAEDGIKEPLELWSHEGHLSVQDGKHRLEVARQLGLKTVPAFITDSSDIRAQTPGREARERRQAAALPANTIWQRVVQSSDALRAKADAFADRIGVNEVIRSRQMKMAPMAARDATVESRIIAKEYANARRQSRQDWNNADKFIMDSFSAERRKAMWEAADEQSVAMQRGLPTAGIGLDRLPPNERAVVEMLQTRGQRNFDEARSLRMVETDGLPSYAPRMLVKMTGKETVLGAGAGSEIVRDIRTLALANARLEQAIAARKLINAIEDVGRRTGSPTVVGGGLPTNKTGAEGVVVHALDQMGRGFSTTTPQLRHRKHLTAAETEAAAQHVPVADPDAPKWFTLDNPAFRRMEPRLRMNETTGRYETVKDKDGNVIFDQRPIQVRSDFEGPLRAVLSKDSDKFYQALMSLKGKAMSVIMMSPLIHNQVEWGRALPAAPGKVLTFQTYLEGNRVAHDPVQMREAIAGGTAPIGGHGFMNDLVSIAEEPNVRPGRSLTAKGLGYATEATGHITRLFNPKSTADEVRRAVDYLGNWYHNTLLWDRIRDLQMGLWSHIKNNLIAKGYNPYAANVAASHFANRYAGALPIEAMSGGARAVANLLLFSRSFTLGNLGAFKDAAIGLPRDAQAMIQHHAGWQELQKIQSFVKRKSRAMLALDAGLYYVTLSALQSAFNTAGVVPSVATLGGMIAGGALGGKAGKYGRIAVAVGGGAAAFGLANVLGASPGTKKIEDELMGYWDRFSDLMHRIGEHPFEVVGHPISTLEGLSSTSENEPGKKGRILVGYQPDGSAIYARLAVGKVTEELLGWTSGANEMLHNKLSTFARPLNQIWQNDVGFGHPLYNKKAETYGEWGMNLFKIVANIVGSQMPIDTVKGAIEWGQGGPGSDVAGLKAIAPFLGTTISKGYPGGPELGILNDARERARYEQNEWLPTIRKQIKNGEEEKAREKMTELGIAPGLQNYYVRTTLNPKARLTKRQMQDFMRTATPEMKKDLEAAQERSSRESRSTGGAVPARAHGGRVEASNINHEPTEAQKSGSVSKGDSSVREPSFDGVGADAKFFGNAARAQAVRIHGFDALDGKVQHVVLSHVRAALNDHKIFRTVIEAIPVDVVDMLVGRQLSAEKLLHDPSMLTHRLSVSGDVAIPKPIIRFVDALAAILKLAFAGRIAKEAPLSMSVMSRREGQSTVRADSTGRLIHRDTVHGQVIETNINPTKGQKQSGNYLKGSVSVHGLDISIENPKGTWRNGIGPDGKPWECQLSAHYGYVKGTHGADDDHIDCYLGPHTKSPHVFVIDQIDHRTGKFDEHKACLGFGSQKQALACYEKAFSDGKGRARIGRVLTMTVPQFKAWLEAASAKHKLESVQ